MIITFGKYKGRSLESIYKIDPAYVEWLGNNTQSSTIRDNCNFLINYKEDKSKIEKIVYESIISRGYSESEANMFISKLKQNK